MITPQLVEIYEKDLEILRVLAVYGYKEDRTRAMLQVDILTKLIKDLKSLESYVEYMEKYNANIAKEVADAAKKQDDRNNLRAKSHNRGL